MQIDTVNNMIKKVADSSQKTTTIINTTNPDFDLCSDTIGIKLLSQVSGENEFEVNLCDSFAAAEKIFLKYYAVSKDKFNNFYLEDSAFLMNGKVRMRANSALAFRKKIKTSKQPIAMYFVFKGHYFNSTNKSFIINSVYSYNLESFRFGGITPNNYNKVVTLLKLHGIS